MAKKTFYDVLQVSPYADTEIIKAAYNSLMQRFYPDGSPGDPNDDFLKALNKAYEVLSDPAKRAGYDAAIADADEDQGEQADATPFTKKATAAPEPNPERSNAPANDSASTSGGDNVDLYEAAIGEKNTTYYLAKFEQFDQQGPGLKAGWNWPAFFLTGFWALYRKMYGWFFVFWGVAFASKMLEKTSAPASWFLVLFATQIAFGVYANSIYYGKVRKKIEAARLTLRDESRLLTYLKQAGGVHTWVIWVFGFVPIIGIVAAIALPAYQDYQKRAAAQQSQQPASGPWDEYAAKQGGASPQTQQPATTLKPFNGVLDGEASPQTQPPTSSGMFDDVLGKDGAAPQTQQPTLPTEISQAEKDQIAAEETSKRIQKLYREKDYEGVVREIDSGNIYLTSDYQQIGMSLYITKRYERALSAFLELDRLKPNDPQIMSVLGSTYFLTGRNELAVATMRQALALAPQDANIRWRLQEVEKSIAKDIAEQKERQNRNSKLLDRSTKEY